MKTKSKIGLWIALIAVVVVGLFVFMKIEKNRAELYAYDNADTIEECDEYLAKYPKAVKKN
ncbi:MAG: hypothetical protein LBR48_09350 [Dysgonamonadaceae bacterium]|nr:hypothetical protein [Dysgonamonadaceae bacterium]